MENRTLHNINIGDIAPNPHNPRLHFDDEDMDLLRISISKVGILVPLTVYLNKKNYPAERYIILDGERRWRCAQSIGVDTVPANIIDEPEDVTQNILYMFNIHHFRTEWEIVPTALKLEVLISKLGSDNEAALAEFTGLTRSIVRRCKMLLWYPPTIRQELINRDSKYSADFLIELYPLISKLSYEPKFINFFSVQDFVDDIVDKYKNNEDFGIKDLRIIRRAFAYYSDRSEVEIMLEKLDVFLKNQVGFEIFSIQDLENDKARKIAIRNLYSLNELVDRINPEFISDQEFLYQLKTLRDNINNLLDKID